MNIFLGIIVGLLVLTTLITLHELGHFFAARRSGVRVKEFGIGFPPRAIAWVRSKPEKGKKKGKWHKIDRKDWQKDQDSLIFSLNWLPIGGFCAMDGESDDETRPGTFGSVSFWEKTKILFAGVAMNWLTAFAVLTILCWTGLPEILDHQFTIPSDERLSTSSAVTVEQVIPGSPADLAGFQPEDRILSINDTPIHTSSDVIDFNNAHAGETVTYALQDRNVEVALNSADSDYLLGITMSSPTLTRHYTWSAPVVAAGLTVQLTGETFRGLGQLVIDLVTGAARQISSDASVRAEGKEQISEATEGVSGIVGIIGGYFPNLITAGPTLIFLFMAVISISLACMNVLPIPALDGGRWFMIFLCRLRHKKLNKEKEQTIVARALIFLLILMGIITIMDIIKLF